MMWACPYNNADRGTPTTTTGDNFGCGSSRKCYARMFFRNSVATSEIYPLESEARICEECKTGVVLTIELVESKLINHITGEEYKLKPIGDDGLVIEAIDIFAKLGPLG